MKYEITAENISSGVRSSRVIDVPLGAPMFDAFIDERKLDPEQWRLDEVVAVGEEDATPPADPQFPDRPTHPDFARLVAAGAVVDEEPEGSMSPPEQIGIDEDSLLYMTHNRLGTALNSPLVQLMPRAIQMQGAWIDGFAVGLEYQKRGGSRPTETGNTGEKEGSS